MNKQAKVQVNGIWRGDFVKIYSIQNLEDTSLVPLLLFYSHDEDPHFTRQQTMTIEDEVDLFMCYDYCTGKIFIFENTIPKCLVIVRYTHPKNNIVKNVNFAADCELTLDRLRSICNKC